MCSYMSLLNLVSIVTLKIHLLVDSSMFSVVSSFII